MSIRKPTTITALTSTIVLAAVFGLGGCAAEVDTEAPEESFVQELDINSDDNNVNDDGFMENWGELPMDWPADISLHSDKITDSSYGETPDGKSWRVDIFPDDLDAEYEAARQTLNDAGFTEESWQSAGGSVEGVFLTGTHRIVVSSAVSVWGDDIVRYEVEPL